MKRLQLVDTAKIAIGLYGKQGREFDSYTVLWHSGEMDLGSGMEATGKTREAKYIQPNGLTLSGEPKTLYQVASSLNDEEIHQLVQEWIFRTQQLRDDWAKGKIDICDAMEATKNLQEMGVGGDQLIANTPTESTGADFEQEFIFAYRELVRMYGVLAVSARSSSRQRRLDSDLDRGPFHGNDYP